MKKERTSSQTQWRGKVSSDLPEALRSSDRGLCGSGGECPAQAPTSSQPRTVDPAPAQSPQRQDSVAGGGNGQAAAEDTQAGHIGAFRDLITDGRNRVDSGRFIAPFAVFGLVFISAWDVIINHAKFDPQSLGVGIGAILGGLAAYLYGDAKHP